ncbi:MAG: hypothetical protein SPF15_07360 [Candidatus Cryptobacteroides sp.]|uniref:hypothetical protein n=1 Tax=Candidatus Cryptobacteroides sp. TaxID=2952915 RepID=UPI002A8112CC|nr:hypothetical protein [Candidatus Cryptobacteroides sp.]MDY5043798.1 hypothetical protein [Candidatus Cryptobacteroides sp.]
MSPSPRQDASGVLVGWVPVPKSCRKPPLPRGDASGVLVGMVPVPKTGQKPPFATRECLRSACGQGCRAEA